MKNTIFLLLSVLIFSCTEPYPKSTLVDFFYHNNSGVEIKIVLHGNFPDTIIIHNGEFYTTSNYGRNVSIPFVCDSIELVFNSSSSVVYKWADNSLINPLKIENYHETRISEHYYKYEYFITERDFLNAKR